MLVTSGQLPVDDMRWLFDVKADGWRMMVYIADGRVRLRSRGGQYYDIPEFGGLARATDGRRCVLDAELVALGADQRPDFGLLNQRMSAGRGAPLALMLFDAPFIDEKLTSLPIEERRERLASLRLHDGAWTTGSFSVGRGRELLAASRSAMLEGLVAKRLGSRYQPGRRSASWLKIKNYEEYDFSLGGWVEHRDGKIGVLVGTELSDGLEFQGVVEIGVGRALVERLRALEQALSPFRVGAVPRGARFASPRLVATIQFLIGTRMRHASIRHVGDREEGAGTTRRPPRKH